MDFRRELDEIGAFLSAAGALLAVTGGVALAQPAFRAQLDLVHVPVTVVDGHGRFVSGLTADEFSVFEDEDPQRLQVFTAESIPISLGMLLDGSTSMTGQRMADAVEAFRLFVREGLAPGDEAFVMAFAGEPVLVRGWTEKTALERLTLDVPVGGGTPMFTTLTQAVGELAGARHVRRVLLLITDGNATDDPAFWEAQRPVEIQHDTPEAARDSDRARRMNAVEAWPARARAALLRSEALVYAVGIDSPPDHGYDGSGPPGLQARLSSAMDRPVNREGLRRLTGETGGYAEIVKSSADLGAAVRRIGDELKHQYLLGYPSAGAYDGKYHRVRVEVGRPGCRVRARHGFQGERRR